MLSYRHAFHAGNFADVLKHSVLTLVIEYMKQKDKAFSYIDTHSGAGLYRLLDDYAQKTGEYHQGIEKLLALKHPCAELKPYLAIINQLNLGQELARYPGSPGIAKQLLRPQDPAHLFELHPADFQLLQQFCQKWRRAHVHQQDGCQGLLTLLPPPSRRAVVLIDPPYELKSDYQQAVETIIAAYKKFSTGCYILWYPVVQRHFVERMQRLFTQSTVRNVLQVEWCLTPDTEAYGMTGTGLFIVNPPWQLAQQLAAIKIDLQRAMAHEDASFTIKQLIKE
jgi:23S rRNA (adenine2030-N6)-methyltransferase